MGRVLRVRKNASSTDGSGSSQGSETSKVVRTNRSVLTDNSRNIVKHNKTKNVLSTDSSGSSQGSETSKVVRTNRNVLTDNSRNIVKCNKSKNVLSTDGSGSSQGSETSKVVRTNRSVLTDNSRNIVKQNKSKNVLSTDSSGSSQGSDTSKVVRTNRIVLTDNSRNIVKCNKSNKLNGKDVASVGTCKVENNVKNDIVLDRNPIPNECASTVLTGSHKTCSSANTVNKGEEVRSVLVDKTNSILQNTMSDTHTKSKNKVHFSSVDRVRKISQRRISDFFHVGEFHHHNDGNKSPRSCQREHRKKILECICHPENSSDSQKPCSSNCVRSKALNNTKHHIPIYKVPVVNGNSSFHLTPPQVEDKNALYDFEVDENEPVIRIKKRRPCKTYKQRKRVCRMVNDVKPTDTTDVPLRTMALRNDGQANKDRINYNEHNNSSVLNVTDIKDLVSSNSNKNRVLVNSNTMANRVTQPKSNPPFVTNANPKSDLIGNKENIPKEVSHKKTGNCVNREGAALRAVQGTSKCATTAVKGTVNKLTVCENSKHLSSSNINKIRDDKPSSGKNHISEPKSTVCENSEHPSSSKINEIRDYEPTSSKNHISEPEISVCDIEKTNSSVVPESTIVQNVENALQCSLLSNEEDNRETHVPEAADISLLPHSESVCTAASRSPLPEYSRIDHGIQVGPLYGPSSVNCSDTEYNTNFVRGITASTPFKTVSTPVRSNNNNFVRLSGGEASNQFSTRSLNDSEDEENGDFFGFGPDEATEESLRYAHLNHQRPRQAEVETNEPVQKITVHEIINLLKQDVYGQKKNNKVKNTVTFQKIYDNNKTSVNENAGESSDSSQGFPSPGQPSMLKYTNSINKDKTNTSIAPEPSESFSKPPRRSYTPITPRKKKRVDYINNEADSEGDELENVAPKKPQKRVKKVSKKEEKEIEKFAAMMNSQFQEVEKFNLVVE